MKEEKDIGQLINEAYEKTPIYKDIYEIVNHMNLPNGKYIDGVWYRDLSPSSEDKELEI